MISSIFKNTKYIIFFMFLLVCNHVEYEKIV